MAKDKCILCEKETQYEFDVNIDYRTGYIEGAGQLCTECYTRGTDREMITIPKRMVMDNPNDMELGRAIRNYYYENY
jgi:hypothetical protein